MAQTFASAAAGAGQPVTKQGTVSPSHDTPADGKVAIRVRLVAQLETPLHIGASGAGGSVEVDKPALRGADQGLILPGSSLKGRLRALTSGLVGECRCHESTSDGEAPAGSAAATRCDVCTLFGREGDQAACLTIGDLHAADGPPVTVTRSSVRIDRHRGVAYDGHLWTVEALGTRGTTLQGEIAGVLPGDRWRRLTALLVAAIRLTRTLGGSQSRGFGWVNWEIQVERRTLGPDGSDWVVVSPEELRQGWDAA